MKEAVAEGFLDRGRDLDVHVMRVDGDMWTADRADLMRALLGNRIGRRMLFAVEPGEVVVISTIGGVSSRRDLESSLPRWLHITGLEATAFGTALAEIPENLAKAIERARFSAALAAVTGPATTVVRWESLGAWRLLLGQTLDTGTIAAISPEADVLIADGGPDHWRTALTYLDSGRKIVPTCQELSIHRATLYYRLERVRELVGEAFDDGWQANALHVALRLHRALIEKAR